MARSGSGVGEFVEDGVNGFLTEDDESMAAALARLASDDTLRRRMRSQPRPSPAQDWPRVAGSGRGGVPCARWARPSAREGYGVLGGGRRRVPGFERVRERLGHGDDPVRLLARAGYSTQGLSSVVGGRPAYRHRRVPVLRTPAWPPAVGAAPGGPPAERGRNRGSCSLRRRAGGASGRAVYAVGGLARGVLLAQNSVLTNAADVGLRAGGLDDEGETTPRPPCTARWGGPARSMRPRGWPRRRRDTGWDGLRTAAWRDFHAVRLVYRADVSEPTDPVVHDADGTTSAAAWFAVDALAALPLTTWTREVLARLSRDGGE